MSDLYSTPSGTVDAVLTGGPTGLVGAIGVQILDADDGSVVTARTTSGITEVPAGSGTYLKELSAPSVPGSYLIFWDTGVVSPSTTATDRLTVTPDGRVPDSPPTPQLVTLTELRTMLGIDPTYTIDDAKYAALLGPASDMIRSYTTRDFGLPVVTEQRTFDYDGSGYLDIDDAAAITDVTLAYPYGAPDITLAADEWTAGPTRRDDAPIYTYVTMPGYVGNVPGSPEMGFKNNLDVYARERGLWAIPPKVKVTGTWGWSAIPGDIKLATVWLVAAWATRPTSSGLTSEAIEGWSRSWGNVNSGVQQLAIPDPVRDILTNYSKIEV